MARFVEFQAFYAFDDLAETPPHLSTVQINPEFVARVTAYDASSWHLPKEPFSRIEYGAPHTQLNSFYVLDPIDKVMEKLRG